MQGSLVHDTARRPLLVIFQQIVPMNLIKFGPRKLPFIRLDRSYLSFFICNAMHAGIMSGIVM